MILWPHLERILNSAINSHLSVFNMDQMSEKSRLIKAAGVVGSATLVSRILGFVRDAVIAWFLGAGFSSDAFIAAFRIPNLLRRLFAEGSLSSAFIPVFTEYVVHHNQDEAFSHGPLGFQTAEYRFIFGYHSAAFCCHHGLFA